MLASIDIGNSQVKIGLFKEDKLYKVENVETSSILTYLRQNNVSNLIISSVSEEVTVNSALKETTQTYWFLIQNHLYHLK